MNSISIHEVFYEYIHEGLGSLDQIFEQYVERHERKHIYGKLNKIRIWLHDL